MNMKSREVDGIWNIEDEKSYKYSEKDSLVNVVTHMRQSERRIYLWTRTSLFVPNFHRAQFHEKIKSVNSIN